MSRWLWYLMQLPGRLWWRASIYGFVAVLTALISIYARRFIPEDIPQTIGADAVDGILNILASSMLAVTIFSISAMVAAYSAATNNLTPRATKLLLEDRLSHSAISTFIGTFIFSIVGIVALKAGAYGDSGRLILFVVTIFIIVIIVITLLRWIDYLARLGRVSQTVERVEEVVQDSLEDRLKKTCLGGSPLRNEAIIPDHGVPVYSDIIGHIQHIDMGFLSEIAEDHKAMIYIRAQPGKFVDSATPLAIVEGIEDEEIYTRVQKAFVIGRERSFRQDPRYGMAVLSEIASRALSPAVNDPGTAIYVISVGVRLLSIWARRDEYRNKDEKIRYPRVYVMPLKVDDLFEDFFPPIARDGAHIVEVAVKLQKAYLALDRTNDMDLQRASRHYAATSLKRALAAMNLQDDKEQVLDSARHLTGDDIEIS